MYLKRLLSIIALGFGSGLSPFAPGTVGSALAAAIFYFLISDSITNFFGVALFFLFIAVSFFIGIFVYSQTADEEDPKSFVWDEFVGMWVACIPLSLFNMELAWLIAAFILFRVFDIWKPWIIKTYDNKSGAFYVMIDDVLAGFFAAIFISLSFLLIS
jgi:phosphatidylglycerophosphatase A